MGFITEIMNMANAASAGVESGGAGGEEDRAGTGIDAVHG